MLFCCAIYFQMPADTTLISDWLDYSYLTFFRTLIKANTSFVLFHGMINNIQNTSIEMLTLWHEQHCTLWLLRSSKCKLCKMTVIRWSAKEYKSNNWIPLYLILLKTSLVWPRDGCKGTTPRQFSWPSGWKQMIMCVWLKCYLFRQLLDRS